jgi:hypothetical protein
MNAFGSGSVANTTATVDPVGTNTADYIQETNANSTHSFYYTYSTATSAATYTYSIYVKSAGQNRWLRFNVGNNINNWFNPDTGSWGTVDAAYTPTATNVGNGWWRVSLTGIAGATTVYLTAGLASANNTTSYAGTGTSGLFVWGADLRPASQATGLIGPTYQRVAAANVYDTAGFLPYLEFDGLSWSMSTGNIDPGADKVQVFAGARKLTDPATALVAEFGPSSFFNAGSFALFSSIGADVRFRSGGAPAGTVGEATASYAAPTTRVFTGIGDISGDVSTRRVNGAQAATSSADQGTGNYLTYPLYIGGRNNASEFFNGNLSSLIVRFGPNLSTSQIEATEAWVNGKTGAY